VVNVQGKPGLVGEFLKLEFPQPDAARRWSRRSLR
jgi:hypothetical protein